MSSQPIAPLGRDPLSLDLAELFRTFTRSAWRLCARDVYDVDVEREPFEHWRATGEFAPRQDGWPDDVRSFVERGATVGRVHILTELGPYAQWCVAGYPENVAAGEDVKVVMRQDLTGYLRDLTDDFWIFDEERVAGMAYDDRGRYLGAYDVTEALPGCLEIRDLLAAAPGLVFLPPGEMRHAVGT